MNRIVYYGSLNNSKSEELFQKMKMDIQNRNGNKFYYLMANGELLTRRRNRLIEELEISFEINLYTFDNIVLNLVNGLDLLEIGDDIKEILIKKAIDNLIKENKIIYYRENISMDGYIKVLSSIIGDLKRSLVRPEVYLSNIKNEAFYKEIGLIYLEYEKILNENNLVDREGMYIKAIELLESGKKIDLDNSLEYIVIDGFYDFRPIEIKILEELLKFNIDIYINIPFKLNSEMEIISSTLESLKEIGFSVEELDEDGNNFIEIGKNLFNPLSEKLYGDIDVVKAPTMELEIKEVFKDIKYLINQGVEPKKIGVISLDERYTSKIIGENKNEKLIINYEYSNSIMNYRIPEELIGLINGYIESLDRNSLLNIIKYNYFNPISKNTEELEYILRRLEWNDFKELEKIIKSEVKLNIIEEERLLVLEALEDINLIYGTLKDRDSLGNYNEFVFELISELAIEENIIEEYKNTRDYFIFKRDLEILSSIKSSLKHLDDFIKIIDILSLEDYYNLLYTKFKNIEIKVHSRNLDGISLLELINSRNMKIEYLFILGMSNNIFPRLDRGNFFINDDNLKVINKTGFKSMNYREKLENEGIKLASAIGSISEKLYIYYNVGVDSENIASIFLDDILNVVSDESVKFREIEIGDFIPRNENDITNRRDILKREIYNRGNRLLGFEEAIEYIEKTSLRDNNNIEAKEDLLEVVNNYTDNRIYSTTVLESYGKCPYYFFLNNILLVEDMNIQIEKYSRIDLGSLYHEVLRVYYLENMEEIKKMQLEELIYSVDYENIKEILFKKSSEFGFKKEEINHSLILENAVDNIYRFIVSDMDRIFNSKNKFIPIEFEKEFGRYGDFIIGNNVKIRGIIDRIDKSLDGENYAVLDYKTSSYGVNDIDSMKEGYSFQIPIYIKSEENRNVNLGIYGIIKSAESKLAMGVIEENPQLSKRNKGAISREEYNQILDNTTLNIEEIVKSIETCKFPVEPKMCSDYCIYRFICRYSKEEEEG